MHCSLQVCTSTPFHNLVMPYHIIEYKKRYSLIWGLGATCGMASWFYILVHVIKAYQKTIKISSVVWVLNNLGSVLILIGIFSLFTIFWNLVWSCVSVCLQYSMHRCKICGKSSTFVCSVCKVVSYCSKECQKRDWKYHKLICGKIQSDYTSRRYVYKWEYGSYCRLKTPSLLVWNLISKMYLFLLGVISRTMIYRSQFQSQLVPNQAIFM